MFKSIYYINNGSLSTRLCEFISKYVNNKNIWQCFNYPVMELLKTSYVGHGHGHGHDVDAVQIVLITTLLIAESPTIALQLRSDRRSSFYT